MIVYAAVGHFVQSVKGHPFCDFAGIAIALFHNYVKQQIEIRRLREFRRWSETAEYRFIPKGELFGKYGQYLKSIQFLLKYQKFLHYKNLKCVSLIN